MGFRRCLRSWQSHRGRIRHGRSLDKSAERRGRIRGRVQVAGTVSAPLGLLASHAAKPSVLPGGERAAGKPFGIKVAAFHASSQDLQWIHRGRKRFLAPAPSVRRRATLATLAEGNDDPAARSGQARIRTGPGDDDEGRIVTRREVIAADRTFRSTGDRRQLTLPMSDK
jgi:hypothetical protein